MATEKDTMLRVRLTQRQSDELNAIIGELQKQMPEASVTKSSIARYALEKYVGDHIAKRDGTKVFIDVNTNYASKEDIKTLYDIVGNLLEEAKENHTKAVHHMVGEIFEPIMMRMAIDMKSKGGE